VFCTSNSLTKSTGVARSKSSVSGYFKLECAANFTKKKEEEKEEEKN
jgi:hypothetical protein